VSSIPTIVVYGLREALRRKVFAVVLLLTAGFLSLYWLANHYVFRDIRNIGPPAGIEPRPFAGAFIFGLAMFATLFLGVVLAVFLTLGTVRGDAERGAKIFEIAAEAGDILAERQVIAPCGPDDVVPRVVRIRVAEGRRGVVGGNDCETDVRAERLDLGVLKVVVRRDAAELGHRESQLEPKRADVRDIADLLGEVGHVRVRG